MARQDWQQQPQRLRERLFWRQIGGLRSRSHLDPPALFALVALLVLLLGLGFFAISALWRLGGFQQQLLQPVADARILTNIRNDAAAFSEAVFHRDGNQLLMASADGTIHRFNRGTKLWDALPPLPDTLSKEIALLRSGCADQTQPCADQDALWLLTKAGGLAQFRAGQWQVLFGDQGFAAAREGTRLTHAAVSADQAWLTVIADSGAVGLYDVHGHTWTQLKGTSAMAVADSAIEDVLWFDGAFWIGSSRGLFRFQPEQLDLKDVPGVFGRVLSMTASTEAGLWVLAEDLCYGGDERCKRLVRFDKLDALQVLLEEDSRFDGFGLQDWHFVHALEDGFVFGGKGGLFVYNPALRALTRVFERDVLATTQTAQGVFFGYDNGLGLISGITSDPEQLQVQNLPDEAIVQFLPLSETEILALSKAGHVFSLDPQTVIGLPIFNPGAVTTDPTQVQHAVDLGEEVLFISNNNLLFHNWDQRTYHEASKVRMPANLNTPSSDLLASGRFIFIRSSNVANAETVTVVDRANLRNGVFRQTFERGFHGPLRSWWNWNDQGIGIIDAHGRLFKFGNGQISELIVPNAKLVSNQQARDVTAYGGELALAFDDGIHYYNPYLRSWLYEYVDQPRDAPVALAGTTEGVFFRTKDQRLMLDPNNGPITRKIGDSVGFSDRLDRLRDVMLAGEDLYFAFPGSVERYSATDRHIDQVWRVPGNVDVALLEIVKDEPLWRDGVQVFHGVRLLSDSATHASADDEWIWLLDRGTYGPYLRAKSIDGLKPDRCFARRPTPGAGATRIEDALRLKDGSYAVMTDAGFFFYNPLTRNWYETGGQFMRRGGRLLLMGDRLAIAQPAQKPELLSLVDVADLTLPGGCNDDPVNLNVQRVNVAAVSAQDDELAAVLTDGSVRVFTAKGMRELLPAQQTNVPRLDSLRRMFDRTQLDQTLWFLGDQDLWRYSFATRLWQNIGLVYPDAGRITVNVVTREVDGRLLVVVKAAGGSHYWGYANAADGVVALNRLSSGASVQALDGSRLLDVQDRDDGVWTFVFEDQVLAFDPLTHAWRNSVDLPAVPGRARYVEMAERAVVTTATGSIWWVGNVAGSVPQRFAAYQPLSDEQTALDSAGRIWRLRDDGRLFRADYPSGAAFRDFDVVSSVPEAFDGDRLQRAFRWRDLVVFDTDRGIRIYHSLSQRFLDVDVDLRDYNRGIDIVRRLADGRLRITTVDQLVLYINETVDGYAFELGEGPDLGFDGEVAEELETLRGFMVERNDGMVIYDPIQRLTVDAAGRLLAERPSGTSLLAQRGALAATQPKALDAGWLAWRREEGGFALRQNDGWVMRAGADVFRAGKPWFVDFEAINATASGFAAISNDGLWLFDDREMRLDRSSVRFVPLSVTGPMQAFADGFVTRSGFVALDGARGTAPTIEARFGDLRLRMSDDGLEISTPLETRNGLTGRGFPWDRGRDSLALLGDRLLLASDAGVHDALALTDFRAAPLALRWLERGSDGSLLARTDLGWSAWRNGAWQQVEAPPDSRLMIDDGLMVWRKVLGGVAISTASGTPIPLINLRAGFALSSDVVRHLQVQDDALFVASAAFVERFGDDAKLGAGFGQRFDFNDVARFKRSATGALLLQREAGQQQVWRTDSQSWTPFAITSDENVLAEAGPLRFVKGANAAIRAEVRMRASNGSLSWRSFALVNGQFPFDRIEALQTTQDELVVGTPLGTQVYPLANLDFSLQAMQPIHETGAVRALVCTDTGTREVYVVASNGTFQMTQGAPQAVSNPPDLSVDRRVDTPFWSWERKGGVLRGFYKDAEAQPTRAIAMQEGFFPHDRFRTVVAHDGYTFYLWQRDWLTILRSEGMNIANAAQNLHLADLKPLQLYRVKYPLEQGPLRLSTGVYLLCEGGTWFHVEPSAGLQPISDPATRKLLDERVRDGAFLERGAMRLKVTNAKAKFQYELHRQGSWRTIPWQAGKLALDYWLALVNWRDKLWAATPIGLAAFERNSDGRVALGTALELIDYPRAVRQEPQILRVQREGEALLVRFDGDADLLFRLSLDQAGRPMWQSAPADQDPFETQSLIEQTEQGWSWRLLGRKDGAPGFLEGRLHDEQVQVRRGRFAFDDVIDLALFEPGLVEWVTAETGWFRLRTDQMAAAQQRRPDLQSVPLDQIGQLDRGRRDGNDVLILRAITGEVYQIDRNGRVEQVSKARHFQGSDGFWQYWQNDGFLEIERETQDGALMQRTLMEKRFSDDILRGLPLNDGQGYVVVTAAGLMHVDQEWNKARLRALPAAAGEAVALAYHEGQLQVAGENGFYAVDATGSRQQGWPNGFEGLPLDVQRLPGPLWQLRSEQGWTLIADGPRLLGEKTCLVNVSGLAEFRAGWQAAGDPWLQVEVAGNNLRWGFASQNQRAETDLPAGFDVQQVIATSDYVYLLSSDDIWQLNLAAALETLRP